MLQKHIGTWAILLLVSLGLWAYNVVDTRILDRSLKSIAAQRRTEVLGAWQAKRAVQAGVSTAVWRELPFVGTPNAKVSVNLRIALSRSRAEEAPESRMFDQTFEFFYVWQDSGWVEMNGRCEHGHETGEELAHHNHESGAP